MEDKELIIKIVVFVIGMGAGLLLSIPIVYQVFIKQKKYRVMKMVNWISNTALFKGAFLALGILLLVLLIVLGGLFIYCLFNNDYELLIGLFDSLISKWHQLLAMYVVCSLLFSFTMGVN